ncbi:redoxin domain-containing protein [Nocardia sp. R6R-6]|uniref:redoxin domain-containing protein n=1 Tax=Nocardia sp. R6R-6 TaxID=3459303 RepID=UPI00403D8298
MLAAGVEEVDVHGNPITLRAALGGRPTVVVTYRGAVVPYCNLALRAYQEQLVPALAERGIGLIAVSPQQPDSLLTTAEKNDLTFTAGPGGFAAAAARYGIAHQRSSSGTVKAGGPW